MMPPSKKILFVLLSICLTTCSSLDINCEFKYEEWVTLGSVYTCHVNNLKISTPNENVTSIIGTHIDGKTNSDVVKLNIEQQTCEFLPNDLEKFFPNLQGLRVVKSGLVELNQKDLSVFPKLRSCDMWNNFLINLDANLFVKSPEIEYLYFGDNRIMELGHNILKPLKKLSKAIFQGNRCVNKNAETKSDVAELQKTFNTNCDPNRFVVESDSSEDYVEHDKAFEKWLKEMERRHKKEQERMAKEEKLLAEMEKTEKEKKRKQQEREEQEKNKQEEAEKEKLQHQPEQEEKEESSKTFWVFLFMLMIATAVGGFVVKYKPGMQNFRATRLDDRAQIIPNTYNELSNENLRYKMGP